MERRRLMQYAKAIMYYCQGRSTCEGCALKKKGQETCILKEPRKWRLEEGHE